MKKIKLHKFQKQMLEATEKRYTLLLPRHFGKIWFRKNYQKLLSKHQEG